VSHLDRANIGNAKIAGLVEDLGMSGIQYNIALSLFLANFFSRMLLGTSYHGSARVGLRDPVIRKRTKKNGANIGNAKIAGLVEDLGMSGIQYNIALSLFFIPYVPIFALSKWDTRYNTANMGTSRMSTCRVRKG
jgi:hypothetical protein